MARRLRDPLVLLGTMSLLSLAIRAAWLNQPCHKPCRSAADHVLVFDETYYVNAARVIAGLRPPANAPYADAPKGEDPNSEHPQLAKLVMAGSIELFGDGPFAWRLGSLVFGSLALLGMFALARAAGADRVVAAGAAALMAADNLLIVHGRIATLDIYVAAAMIWATVLYLRGHPLWAGLGVGVAACFKLVGAYALLVFVLIELLRRIWPRVRSASIRSVAISVLAAATTFIGLLVLLDVVARPYDATSARTVAGGPFAHLSHMISYAANQASPNGPQGIASYPWQWLFDLKPIVYLNINPARPAPGLYGIHPAVHFLGMISPPIMAVGLLALLVELLRHVGGLHRVLARRVAAASSVTLVGLAWVIGTLVPFEFLSAFWSRTSYLYYMVIVMPGIYLLAVDLLGRLRLRRGVLGAYALAVLVAAVVMYPFTPLP